MGTTMIRVASIFPDLRLNKPELSLTGPVIGSSHSFPRIPSAQQCTVDLLESQNRER